MKKSEILKPSRLAFIGANLERNRLLERMKLELSFADVDEFSVISKCKEIAILDDYIEARIDKDESLINDLQCINLDNKDKK